MRIAQTWHSVMDGTYQSRASPLDRKHFDECSSLLMCDCMNMQELVRVVYQCIWGRGVLGSDLPYLMLKLSFVCL